LRFDKIFLPSILVLLSLLLSLNTVSAQDESAETVEKLMIFQMEALRIKNHQAFIKHGNEAFKSFMDEYTFDSLILQRSAKIEKGYQLEYLGDIKSIGMRRHLWKVHISGDKYQLLGSLSLSHGKVVGFSLE
jgi:hypothetical protein